MSIAVAAVTILTFPTASYAKQPVSNEQVADFQKQVASCISKAGAKTNSAILPRGGITLSFELIAGGHLRDFKIAESKGLKNIAFGKMLLNEFPKCAPFRTKIVGTISLPVWYTPQKK